MPPVTPETVGSVTLDAVAGTMAGVRLPPGVACFSVSMLALPVEELAAFGVERGHHKQFRRGFEH